MASITRGEHKLEAAGLGSAPFKFIGHEERKFQACPGAPIRPGASCDYCATAIVDCYWFESSDGRRFKLGCDCFYKAAGVTGESRDVPRDPSDRAAWLQVRRAVAAAAAEKRRSVAARKSAEIDALLSDDAVRSSLAALPHPSKYRADEGATMLDWATWMRAHAGMAGEARTLKAIKVALAKG